MSVTISGGIFNFTDTSYLAPTWSGGDTYSFGEFQHSVVQLYTDEALIYAATENGVSIFDLPTETFYAYVTSSGGFTTIGGNSDKIYLGTTSRGIKVIDKTCVSGSLDSPIDISACLNDFTAATPTSQNIRYLNMKGDQMVVCTAAGIDYFRFNQNPFIHSTTSISGAQKCFVTDNSMYYTVSGTNTTTSGMEYSLNRLDACLTDWLEPTMSYTTGSGMFLPGLKLTDMYITEGTAVYGGNTIFCTTTSGIYVIDEDNQNYAIYYTG